MTAPASRGESLSLDRVSKQFTLGERVVPVLEEITFGLSKGEAVALTGPSGSGKSTLLHIIGTLDRPTSGTVSIDGQNPHAFAEPDLARFRNETIGFVFQAHHLLPQYTVLENVLLPTLAFPEGAPPKARAEELLQRVGLGERLEHRPGELSGGESQRVAVARSLINRPGLLLCDEPTGSLDRENAAAVMSLLLELQQEEQTMLIVVTHSVEQAERFPRRLELSDRRLSAT